jgi:hypothetical protein
MVPRSNHDFSQYSWLTALTVLAKLAVILVTALCLLYFVLMVLLGDTYGTECPEDSSLEYEDCILPN